MATVGLIASIILGPTRAATTATTTTTLQKAFADFGSDHCSSTQSESDPFIIRFFGPNTNEFAKAIKKGCKNLK
jgi:hypothetical protein